MNNASPFVHVNISPQSNCYPIIVPKISFDITHTQTKQNMFIYNWNMLLENLFTSSRFTVDI
jgi:hypothetical protein